MGPPPEGFSRPPGGPIGPGPGAPGPMFRPGMLLPPFLVDRLGLNSEQREKLEALQKESAERLNGILNEEQREMVKRFTERAAMGGMRPGGPQGAWPGRGPEMRREERARGDRPESGRPVGPPPRDGERPRTERPDRPRPEGRGEVPRGGRPEGPRGGEGRPDRGERPDGGHGDREKPQRDGVQKANDQPETQQAEA